VRPTNQSSKYCRENWRSARHTITPLSPRQPPQAVPASLVLARRADPSHPARRPQQPRHRGLRAASPPTGPPPPAPGCRHRQHPRPAHSGSDAGTGRAPGERRRPGPAISPRCQGVARTRHPPRQAPDRLPRRTPPTRRDQLAP
jgi:hypothetical protein